MILHIKQLYISVHFLLQIPVDGECVCELRNVCLGKIGQYNLIRLQLAIDVSRLSQWLDQSL